MGLGACGSEPEPANNPVQATPEHTGGPVAGPHNELDITYAKAMFIHSQQAVELATMAASKSNNAEVKKLAETMQAEQSPYMATLGGMLSGWGQQAPGMGGEQGDHSDHAGALTEAEIAKLGSLSAQKFDAEWLKAILKHHQGAISQSKKIQEMGQNPEVKKFAQQLVTVEEPQIAEIRKLYKSL